MSTGPTTRLRLISPPSRLSLISPSIAFLFLLTLPSALCSSNQHGCINCGITPLQRCACAETLKATGRRGAYLCDPHADDRFLVCVRDQVFCQPCSKGLFWNYESKACSPVRKCQPVPWQCTPTTTTTTTTTTTPIPTTTTAANQHGCIDCDITPLQRCICAESLKLSGAESAYLCDPESDDRFLVCTPGAVVCQPCAQGMKWNADSKACAPERKCLPVPSQCSPTAIAPAPTAAAAPAAAPAEVITQPPPPPATTTPPPYCEIQYEFHPEKLNWFSASKICEVNLGNLATITNLRTQNYLQDRFGSRSSSKFMWIGASDHGRQGNWKWINGESFGFTNWASGSPTGENCLQFNCKSKGAWMDEDCRDEKPFLCEFLVCY